LRHEDIPVRIFLTGISLVSNVPRRTIERGFPNLADETPVTEVKAAVTEAEAAVKEAAEAVKEAGEAVADAAADPKISDKQLAEILDRFSKVEGRVEELWQKVTTDGQPSDTTDDLSAETKLNDLGLSTQQMDDRTPAVEIPVPKDVAPATETKPAGVLDWMKRNLW
jgi:hypothetical protein